MSNRKILGTTFLTASFMVLNTVSTQAAVDEWFTEGDLSYTILTEDASTGTVEVEKFGDVSGNIVIPATVKKGDIRYSVTRISDSAFFYSSRLTGVTIGDSITVIGENAFSKCSNLVSITIGNSVTAIGVGAFSGCDSLTNIFVSPDNPEYSSMDGVLFNKDKTALLIYPSGKEDQTYHIPSSVTKFKDAFYNSHNLGSITIPNGITEIEDDAFEYCHSLTSITIPDCVTAIGKNAFRGCRSLTEITIPCGVTMIGDSAFRNCNLTSIVIPDSVTEIGADVFFECRGLINITIGNNVAKIEEGVFLGCNSLTSVTIPESVTAIGKKAFWGCSALSSITLPTGIASIGEGAFYECSGLTSITVPGSITSIAADTFYGCSGLTSITIPNSVTAIGKNAFDGCSSLTSITVPDGTARIGDYAFARCNGLTTITIPDNVTSIGMNAFIGTSLTNISVSPDNPKYSSKDGVLFNKDKSTLILYPQGKKEESYIIPGTVTEIEDRAFSGCSSLSRVTIIDGVTEVAATAFYFCPNLTEISVSPDNPNYSSEDGVLFNKNKTTLVCYPAGKEDISYTIPNSVNAIGDKAFALCGSLTRIIVSAGVSEIGDDAFVYCKSLTSVYYMGDVPKVSTSELYASNPNTLVSYYPRRNTSWEKAITDGMWQKAKVAEWDQKSSSHRHFLYGIGAEKRFIQR